MTFCQTQIAPADKTCWFTKSQYTETGPASPTANPITPGWSPGYTIFVTGMTRPGFESRTARTRGGHLNHLAIAADWKRERTRALSSVGCLTSQQHASVSQGRICADNFTCCHTEIEVADQTFHLTQSQYTDTGPTSPSTDPLTPGAWQGSHWNANF